MAKQLLEKYYCTIKNWVMRPNAEDFAEMIQNIDEIANWIGKGVNSETIEKKESSIDREKLIKLIMSLPEEKLLLINEYVEKINTH
ncbi:hypothetical protein MKX34_03505 [Paenibacillus sp. FSL R5-0636]|uniref:hypothetical protein n=1 Tax=Paenibacillus TaxID=44249 RepID=UPI00096DD0D5|nr:hypothetical protein [Paenibacillus odorifer]OMD02300.1 hypothetical protein BJP46_16570 [Paenibacillus odorifer]OMD05174.1 hypothetical protein BJP49_20725 [Paenibacillus odorifer]